MENCNKNKLKSISFVSFIVTYPQRNFLRHQIEQLGIYLGENMFIYNDVQKTREHCDQGKKRK